MVRRYETIDSYTFHVESRQGIQYQIHRDACNSAYQSSPPIIACLLGLPEDSLLRQPSLSSRLQPGAFTLTQSLFGVDQSSNARILPTITPGLIYLLFGLFRSNTLVDFSR